VFWSSGVNHILKKPLDAEELWKLISVQDNSESGWGDVFDRLRAVYWLYTWRIDQGSKIVHLSDRLFTALLLVFDGL